MRRALAILVLPLAVIALGAADGPTPGERLWGQGEDAPVVVAREGDDVVVRTAVGEVAIAASLAGDPANGEAFRRALARIGGLALGDGARPRFARAALTGLRLQAGDALVVEEGVLRGAAIEAPPLAARAEALAAAATALAAAVPRSPARPAAATALARALAVIGSGKPDADDRETTAAVVRSALRPEVLSAALGELPEIAAWGEALANAERLEPVREWRGDGLVLRELRDAVGGGGWVFARPDGVRLLVHPRPTSPSLPPREAVEALNLVIDLPPGGDPSAADAWTRPGARVALRDARNRELARWDAAAGLVADADGWNAAFAGLRDQEGLVPGWWPPHIPVHGLDGRLLALITAHGAVAAPTGAPGDAERFLADAARALPDGAHLDLLRVYAFAYAYDSPDPARPRLIGVERLCGDIHQTAEQTLATAVGGVCHGDCDDLAELFQRLLVRQGRLAHVLHLPAHLAAGWAEPDGDGWRATTLQTGPPWTFTGATCAEALGRLYHHFSPTAPFDPSQVAIALRFAGENTRSTWVLGERIFREPAYAATMIDVERDWRYRTYRRAIEKMKALIAGGDDDTANWSELEGLYARTGDWRKAVECGQRASAGVSDREGRLLRVRRMLRDLAGSGDDADTLMLVREARRLLPSAVADDRDPDGKDPDGPRRRRVQQALELAAWLRDDLHRDEKLALLRSEVVPWVEGWLPNVRAWMAKHPGRRLPGDRWTRDFTAIAGGLVNEALALQRLMADRGDPPAADLVALTDRWLTEFTFAAVEEDADVLADYASVGWWLRLRDGDDAAIARIAAAGYPATAEREHAKRAALAEQADLDLAWIDCSPSFWRNVLDRDFARANFGDHPLDLAAVDAHTRAIEAAVEHAEAIGLASPRGDVEAGYARLARALLLVDPAVVAKTLDDARAAGDDRRWQSIAMTIGGLAKWMDPPWFRRVLGLWREHADQKPFWFELAWSAARTGAATNAHAAAEEAARRYPGETEFAEERRWLDQLLDERGGEAPLP